MNKLQQLSYLHKNLLSLAVFLVFAIVAYFLSIKKTINLSKENSAKEERLTRFNTVNRDLRSISTRLDEVNEIVKVVDNPSYRQELLQYVSQVSDRHNVQIKLVDKPQLYKMSGLDVEMNIMLFSGSHRNLVKSIYEMENSPVNPGDVSSIIFEKSYNRALKKDELNCRVYFQIIKSP